MRCQRVKRRLSAWLDGEVGERERQAVEAHLHTCAGCTAEAERLRRAWEWVGLLPEMEPVPGFEVALWERIDEREARTARRPVWWPVGPRLAWATGFGIALSLWLGITLGRGLAQPPVTQEAARQAVLDSWSVTAFYDLPPQSVGGTYFRLVADNGGNAR
jgi:anti-sigma factor RsiW